jgi:hypothetical protein
MNTSNLRNFRPGFFRATGVLSLALTLSACVLGTKVGDLPGVTSDASESGDTGTGGDSSSDATSGPDTGSDTATDGPVTTSDTATDGPVTTTGASPGMCEGLDEDTCQAFAECRAQYGSAFAFAECPIGPQYLGCIASDQACDLALTPVCRDGTDEVYLNSDGCVPAGFSACATALAPCGECEGLAEAECLAQPAGCQGLYGAPHIEVEGMECVDFEQQVFLACAANGGACPPFVPTVCPAGDPDTKFDVPSGCIPFGFEVCDGGAPECL